MGDGWFIKVKLSSPEELDDLMDESAYNNFIEE
jgi:glycine cleavage system H protein